MSAFVDEVGTYDFTITTPADWTVSSGGLPNGDNYVTGDGTIAETSNVNGDDFNFVDGTAWSVEFWFYYATATAVFQFIIANHNAGTSTSVWEVAFGSGEVMRMNINNTASGAFLQVDTPFVLSTGTWYHICYVKETGNVLKHYVDGVLCNTDATTSGTARTPTSTYRLYLGTAGDGSSDLGASSSGARIAKLAIYNRELTQAEMGEHIIAMVAT